MPEFSLQDVRELTYKRRDAWWTVLLVDPLASRLVKVTANRTSITPNQLTSLAAILGLLAAGSFALADWPWLVTGAVLFHLSFVVDCMDGKIARLKGTGSVFGAWLDFLFDRLRDLVCAVALMGGQYAATGNPVFIWFALGIVATEMFRYLNAPQMAKVRTSMRRQLTRAITDAETEMGVSLAGASSTDAELRALSADLRASESTDGGETRAVGETPAETDGSPEAGARRKAREVQATDLQQGFHSHFPWYTRVRGLLREHRIRPHLFSGIEFTMGVFIIAPLVGAVSTVGMLGVIAFCGAAMLLFEVLLVYKLWLSTREFARVLRRIEQTVEAARSSTGDGGGEGTAARAAPETGEADTTNGAAPDTRGNDYGPNIAEANVASEGVSRL